MSDEAIIPEWEQTLNELTRLKEIKEKVLEEIATLEDQIKQTIFPSNLKGKWIEAGQHRLRVTEQAGRKTLDKNLLIAKLHMEYLKEHIPVRKRAYLIVMMSIGNEFIGHLYFIGNKIECFDQEDATRVQMLVTHFGEVVEKLLQNARVQKHQKKIELAYEKKFKTQVEYCIGENAGLKEIMETVQQLENSEISVLIRGETGTGKEVIADIIHKFSKRKDTPFIKINCGAIPETLIDSELFGNVLPMEMPPLRKRKEDVSALIFHFIKMKIREQKMSHYPIISLATHKKLLSYSWSGNIRELENLIERGLTIYPSNKPNTILSLENFLPEDEGWYLETENDNNYFIKLIDERLNHYFSDTLDEQGEKSSKSIQDIRMKQKKELASHLRNDVSDKK